MKNVFEQTINNGYALYHGDSCEIIKEIPDNSIHYTIFHRRFQVFILILTATETWATAKTMMSFIGILYILQKNFIELQCPADFFLFIVWICP